MQNSSVSQTKFTSNSLQNNRSYHARHVFNFSFMLLFFFLFVIFIVLEVMNMYKMTLPSACIDGITTNATVIASKAFFLLFRHRCHW